jgi:hypothetical protein
MNTATYAEGLAKFAEQRETRRWNRALKEFNKLEAADDDPARMHTVALAGWGGFPKSFGGKMDPETTLRDQFAIAALQGDWASSLGHFDADGETEHLRDRAQLYYRMADAMMAERQIDRKRVFPFRRKDDPQA